MSIYDPLKKLPAPPPERTIQDVLPSYDPARMRVVFIQGLEAELIHAVMRRDLPHVRQCIDAGCDPNFAEGWPLRRATEAGSLDILAYLLPLTDVEATGHKALKYACTVGESPGAVELLATRADADILRRAASHAQSFGHDECARVLLRSLAELEAQDLELAAQPAQALAAQKPRI